MHVRLVICLSVVAFGLALWAPSSARALEQEGHDRWVPSLAVTSGFSMVGLSGSVESMDSMGEALRD